MDVEIRSAQPGDAAFLAWVVLTAGRSHCQRGVWDVVLGRPEDECLELLAATETPHMFHYACSTVAEVDGCPVAALSGYDPKQLGVATVGQALQEVHQKLGLTGSHQVDNQRGMAAILYCYPEETEGAWIIENVATLPEFRRRGVINTLLEEILEKGRRLGFSLA